MATTLTEQTLRSTYKDDYKDSDNYHRILFNAGRALQARELTQLQTILQKEIARFGMYVLEKDGVEVSAGGSAVTNTYSYIKISNDANNSFDDISTLEGTVLTGATSSIKVRVVEAVAAVGSDPDTIYVQYLENPNTISPANQQTDNVVVTLGEVLSNGSNINLTVQTTNTTANRAIGFGSIVETNATDFFVAGHFVYADKQKIFLDKYKNNQTVDYGFKVVQDIITVTDTDALYDNQAATPNRSSPGADRLRIRLILTKRNDVVAGDTYLHVGRVVAGRRFEGGVQQAEHKTFKYVDERINDLAGDFIKKYWKTRVTPNGKTIYKADGTVDDYFKLIVDPGSAYIQGKRVKTDSPKILPLKRATETIERSEDQIGISYGNYMYFDSGVGMLDVDTCETVDLLPNANGTGTKIGTANVRAITQGEPAGRLRIANGRGSVEFARTPSYKLHLFNVQVTNLTKSIGDVMSVKSATNTHYVTTVRDKNNINHIYEQEKAGLLFDAPIRRPKSFLDVTYTFMKKYNFTASAATKDITLTDAGESFVNVSDVLIAATDDWMPSGVSASLQSNNKVLRLSGLTSGKAYEVIGFIKKTNSAVKNKDLVETTVTGTLDSDGKGWSVIKLGASDIYSVDRVRKHDSDGEDIFPHFRFDAGARMQSYEDGRLLYQGGGLDSANQPIFVRFKHFSPDASGAFFAVNSYDGEVDYLKIPAQTLRDGNKVSLRDVIDFRPSTNGYGVYNNVPLLPVPSDTITADATYYLPRLDKLIINPEAGLKIIRGSSSLNPKYPAIPEGSMDLYNIRMEPNTMHTEDITQTLIPRKGFTMADIGKLEKKVERLEEVTALSLLELNTKFMDVLDSGGRDRAKSGFFVDSFVDHQHTQNKGEGAKSAIDGPNKTLRPRAPEENVSLFFDSADVLTTGVTKIKRDKVVLNYTGQLFEAQELASGTENLAPFYQHKSLLRMKISPEVDRWKDTEYVGQKVVGKSTKLDLREALNWNNSANSWYGINPDTLEVGDQNGFTSATSTTVVTDNTDPILIGSETTETLGEWVEVGTVTDVQTLYTETVEISRERTEEISRSAIDSWWNWTDGQWTDWSGWYGGYEWGGGYFAGDFGLGGYGTGYGYWDWGQYWWGDIITTDMWDVVTTETRTGINTVNTSTYEQTRTIETTNTYQSEQQTTTTTTTSNTVNRVASESSISEVVGDHVLHIQALPIMRSIEIFFQADGCRPNTQYFPFFDNTNVSSFCREETAFKEMSTKHIENAATYKDNDGVKKPTQEHSRGKSNLISDANGTIIGSFEVPCNSAMKFSTGQRVFDLNDVNSSDRVAAISSGSAIFTSAGQLETREQHIHIVRTLKIVGSETTSSESETTSAFTTWTETLVDETVATDVRVSETQGVIVGNQTTTTEYAGQTIEYEAWDGIWPVADHSSDTGTPAGGTNSDAGTDGYGTTGASAQGGRVNDYEGEMGIYHDPIAQTFQISQAGGVMLTDVEVFFSSKGSTGVAMEIRPTVNGVPSSSQIIEDTVLMASQINVVPDGATNKVMLQNGTTFSIPPTFLSAPGEYAICLRPLENDPDFNVYVGKVGEFQLGTTEARIQQQPILGSFFKSQNSRVWEPASDTDLAYRLTVARFATSGTAMLHNTNVEPEALAKDPLIVDSGSNSVRVMFGNHGLRVGDITNIRGIDSATNFGNGLTGAQVNGIRVVTGMDNSGYTYQADATATSRKWFGGKTVTSSQNVNYEIIRPNVGITQPSNTNVTVSLKGVTQQSLAGTETRFVKDTKFEVVEDGANIRYNNARAIYNRRTEDQTGAGKMAGARSLDVQVNMTTTNPFLTPILDLQSTNVMTMHNLISRQDSAATDGYNVPLTYISELSPSFGTESAKHITKVTTLSVPATGLKIMVAANRPPQADFQMYFKVAQEGSNNIDKMTWALVEPESTIQPDINPNTFREYRYLVGGDEGNLPEFTQFQVKIVMRSISSAHVPSFRDLRVIALAT